MTKEKNICCILGDSISEGIGSKKINYIKPLKSLSDNRIEFLNLAKTGTTIRYAEIIQGDIKNYSPNIIIIGYGAVDAQIRANIWRNRFRFCDCIPKRYKTGGMLEPRAFYSKKWYRIIPDRIDNLLRFLIKKVVLITQGTVQWVSLSDFEQTYESILQSFSEKDRIILLLSTVYIDDNYFLNSSKEYIKYNNVIRELGKKYSCRYVDLFNSMKNIIESEGWNSIYSFDHFHPNERGYEVIAQLIWSILKDSFPNETQND